MYFQMRKLSSFCSVHVLKVRPLGLKRDKQDTYVCNTGSVILGIMLESLFMTQAWAHIFQLSSRFVSGFRAGKTEQDLSKQQPWTCCFLKLPTGQIIHILQGS